MSQDILLADLDLVRLIETAWTWSGVESALAYQRAEPEKGVAVERIGRGAATYFGPGSPLSQAQGFGLDGPDSAEALDRLEAFYDHRAMATNLEVASLADPSFLPMLSARGYRIAEQTHMLARSLDDLETIPDVSSFSPLGPSVARVAGHQMHLDWSRVVLHGFFEGDDDPPQEVADVMAAMTAAPSTSGWLATTIEPEEEGKDTPIAAGGASLLFHEQVGLFAGDATLSRYRGRGIQRALIAARLKAAIEAGCRLGVVCVNPGSASQRNYERFGFRLVHARTLMVREHPTTIV